MNSGFYAALPTQTYAQSSEVATALNKGPRCCGTGNHSLQFTVSSVSFIGFWESCLLHVPWTPCSII